MGAVGSEVLRGRCRIETSEETKHGGCIDSTVYGRERTGESADGRGSLEHPRPGAVVLAYTEDSEWRNRTEFLKGRREVRAFLCRKWTKELDYRLRKKLWGFRGNRMAVSFEYEWHDDAGQWYRSYGIELWAFNEAGLMQQRIASINDAPIEASERWSAD